MPHKGAGLLDSSELLARTAEIIDLCPWELNVASRTFESSFGLGELFGLPAGQNFTSDDLMARVVQQDAHAVLLSIREVVQPGGSDRFLSEYRVNLPDGSVRCLKSVGAVLSRRPDGTAERMCGVTFDVSQRRRADEKRQEHHDRIVQLSRLSAMGFLASTITHELNQPLTALINNLTACEIGLQAEAPNPALLELMEANKRLVMRISEIIRRTRSFISSGKIVRTRGSLIHVIRSTVSKLLLLPGNGDLRISYELDPTADAVDADMVQIEHVLYNILRNASEAMAKQAHRALKIQLSANGNEVDIHIIDNGPGLSSHHYEQLFEPLWTSKDEGTGLGLAICRTIVEAHGGVIAAGPGPDGRGLDFHLTLPIRAQSGPPSDLSDLAVVAGS